MKIGRRTRFWYKHLSNIGDCEIGEECVIHSHTWVGDGVKIGDRVKIQSFAFIPEGVIIGSDVFIGPHVCFVNDRNPPSSRDQWEETVVENEAIIGANATIMCGITLGKGCMIGAGAVITKSVPPFETWVGNPARKL